MTARLQDPGACRYLSTMQNWEAGRTLGGKYRLVRQLGQGGMGSVWHAEHLTLSSPVALKLIEPGTAEDPGTLQRFLREARTAAALRSPHVVQILDYGVDDSTPYIAMELLEGESLAERLSRVGQLSRRETGRVIQHVARAIARAHEAGIVHRDLKPENVFIVKNDDEEVVKVLDFGVVKERHGRLGASALAATRTGTLLGTPYYMSPEQTQGEKSVDHRADIWAVGVIAFKCLAGRLPFNGDSVGKLILEICSEPLPIPSRVGTVPRGFDAWFARACARDRAQRFQSAKEAAAAFAQLDKHGVDVSEPPSRAAEPSQRALIATTGHSANSEVVSHPRRATPRWLLVGLGAAGLAGFALWSATRPADTGLTRDTSSLKAPSAHAEPLNKPPAALGPQRTTPSTREGVAIGGPTRTERTTISQRPLAESVAAAGLSPSSTRRDSQPGNRDGRVDVRSAPKGAAVFVDGEPTGLLTPVVLKGLPNGRSVKLLVAKAGFASQEREIKIVDGSVETHTFELLASAGLVFFRGAPEDARIYVDDMEVVAREQEPIRLSVGTHAVRVETPNALVFSGNVVVVAGEQTIRVGAGASP